MCLVIPCELVSFGVVSRGWGGSQGRVFVVHTVGWAGVAYRIRGSLRMEFRTVAFFCLERQAVGGSLLLPHGWEAHSMGGLLTYFLYTSHISFFLRATLFSLIDGEAEVEVVVEVEDVVVDMVEMLRWRWRAGCGG
jgi:hypothetical protein